MADCGFKSRTHSARLDGHCHLLVRLGPAAGPFEPVVGCSKKKVRVKFFLLFVLENSVRVPDSDLRAALKQALGLLDYSNVTALQECTWVDQGVVDTGCGGATCTVFVRSLVICM